jgi:hypothetical protein
LGFQDPDRKHNTHDEIQIWVYRNLELIAKKAFPHIEVDRSRRPDITLEHAVVDTSNNRNFIVGFIDVYCTEFAIGIEVKTEIPQVGELIRQIQFYKKYLNVNWVVVSPDDRNSGILSEQGIFLSSTVAGCQTSINSIFFSKPILYLSDCAASSILFFKAATSGSISPRSLSQNISS